MIDTCRKLGLMLTVACVSPWASVASAHVSFEHTTAATNEAFFAHLAIPTEHGVCSAGTSAVVVTIPKGAKLLAPRVKQGWTVDVAQVVGNAQQVTWRGGEVPLGSYDVFEFAAWIDAPAGSRLNFDVTQACHKVDIERVPSGAGNAIEGFHSVATVDVTAGIVVAR